MAPSRDITVRPLPHVDASDLVRRLDGVGAATVGHEPWARPLPGLRPLRPGMRLVGPAVPVVISPPDSGPVHVVVDLVRPGDVVVVGSLDAGSSIGDRAPVGGIIATLLHAKGAAGVVVDGPVADVAEILALGLPVFSRGTSPVTTAVVGGHGSIGAALWIGPTCVGVSDVVVGDDDGALVAARHHVLTCADALRARERAEPGLVQRVLDGAPLAEVTGAAGRVTTSPVPASPTQEHR